MSKSPSTQIFLPAAGIGALILGVGYGVATTNYGNERIAALEANFAKEREAVTAERARVGELETKLAELEARAEDDLAAAEAHAAERIKAAESEIEALRAELETASAAGQSETSSEGGWVATAAETAAASTATPAASTTQTETETGTRFGLGREALEEEIAAWDVNVLPDGRGLPEGSGDVWTGDEVFGEYCASCHGDFAEGRGAWPSLAGGFGTLDKRDPVKTVGSYWPYLSTVWDYVHRSMPFGAAGTLTDDEVYAITAYILYSNDLVEDDFTLSPETFLEVEMPNLDGFIVDDRPETEYPMWSGEPCMTDCKEGPVEITRRSSDVGVTPADDGSMAESVMERQLAELGGVEWGAERVAGSVFMDPDAMAADQEAEERADEVEMASVDTTDEGAGDAAATEGTDAATEEVASTEATDGAATDTSEGPDPDLVAAGKSVFRQCSACHEVGEGARNKSGPQLNGVVGRVAGSVDGFRYSSAFEEANEKGLVWNEDELHAFLSDPRGYMPGTRMSFRGVKSEDDLDAITAYLESFSE